MKSQLLLCCWVTETRWKTAVVFAAVREDCAGRSCLFVPLGDVQNRGCFCAFKTQRQTKTFGESTYVERGKKTHN